MARRYPEPTVGAVITNPQGKIFLMRSHKFHDRYVIPGGHVEVGETMETALKREIKEETGLTIYDLEFICFHESIFDPGFHKKKHLLFFDYACRTRSTKVRLNEEGQSYVWVLLPKAMRLDLEPYTRKTLELYSARWKRQSRQKR